MREDGDLDCVTWWRRHGVVGFSIYSEDGATVANELDAGMREKEESRMLRIRT